MVATSRIILGTMTFGPEGTAGARISTIEQTKECLQLFKDRGYSEIDTARTYCSGQCEAWLTESGWQTEFHFSIATKVYPTEPYMHTKERLTELFNVSMAELKADKVDIFYLHAADRAVPFAETLEAVNEIYKAGKFKILGISNYTSYELAEAVTICRERGYVMPKIYQGRYNAVTRDIELELFPALRHYGIDFVAYNPLAGGLLSGKYNTRNIEEAATSGRFTEGSAQGKQYRARYFRSSYWEALDVLEAAVKETGIPLYEMALRWMVHHSALRIGGPHDVSGDGIIIGISSKEQLATNLDSLEKGPLPQAALDALDKAALAVKLDSPNYWHGTLYYPNDPIH
ncbi:NADP-dependent oxidoreductase domain-containing protein [Dipodascopsis tothii]|uniref:NADP-dependent oxidoreductase domain-containing protein n=1 Tax=Dipodascopsis tothii TaxID=44089 RepID=UPI0034CD7DA2